MEYCMEGNALRKISDKRLLEIKEEVQVRQSLCQRAGGFWNGLKCEGGYCEECGKPSDWMGLHPHHSGIGVHRKSLDLKDKMLCMKCHMKAHHERVAEDQNVATK